jgi:hypothetical protein
MQDKRSHLGRQSLSTQRTGGIGEDDVQDQYITYKPPAPRDEGLRERIALSAVSPINWPSNYIPASSTVAHTA